MLRFIKGELFWLFVFLAGILLRGIAFADEKKAAKVEVESLLKNGRLDILSPTAPDISGIIKFEERFNDSLPPDGWQTVDADSSGLTWGYFYGVNFYNGDSIRPQAGYAFWGNEFRNANGDSIADWLLTPQLPTLEAGDSLYVYVTAISLTYADTLTIWASVTDDSIPSFTSRIGMVVDPGPVGEWHLYAFDITLGDSLAGQDVYVGFKHDHKDGGPSGNGSNWVSLDHVILANGGLPPVGIANNNANQPDGFVLKQNYPNPFNPSTNLGFRIADFPKGARGFVSLEVFDVTGKKIATLVHKELSPGEYVVQWDGRDSNGHQVASGIYLYRLQAGSRMQTKKMLLLK